MPEDAMRRPQLTQHGRRGSGVGRGDYGAERNRCRPRHLGQQIAYDEGDRDSGQSHRKHNQT